MLSVLVFASENRAWLWGSVLTSTMVPTASAALLNGALYWVMPHRVFRYLDNCIYETFMRSCCFVFENLAAAKINLYGDIRALRANSESAIIISNHQSDVDWVVINSLAARHSPTGQQYGLRFVLKRAIHYVPLYGWYTLQRGFFYVCRSGGFRPEPAVRQLNYLKTCQPFWLTIFPEGTRFNASKTDLIAQSEEYCKERRLDTVSHVLTPRAGALQLAVSKLYTVLDSFYDVTIAYSQARLPGRKHDAPIMFEFVTGRGDCHNEVHVHVRRLAIDGVPKEASELKLWLHNRFVEKDKLMETFYNTGRFPEPVETPTRLGSTFANLSSFLVLHGAVLSAYFFPQVRQLYAYTILSSPLLLFWIHFRGLV